MGNREGPSGGLEEIEFFTGVEIALLDESSIHLIRHKFIDLSSKRNVAEGALRDSEEKYRYLFDNMREGFAYCRMIFDPEGRPVDRTS